MDFSQRSIFLALTALTGSTLGASPQEALQYNVYDFSYRFLKHQDKKLVFIDLWGGEKKTGGFVFNKNKCYTTLKFMPEGNPTFHLNADEFEFESVVCEECHEFTIRDVRRHDRTKEWTFKIADTDEAIAFTTKFKESMSAAFREKHDGKLSEPERLEKLANMGVVRYPIFHVDSVAAKKDNHDSFQSGFGHAMGEITIDTSGHTPRLWIQSDNTDVGIDPRFLRPLIVVDYKTQHGSGTLFRVCAEYLGGIAEICFTMLPEVGAKFKENFNVAFPEAANAVFDLNAYNRRVKKVRRIAAAKRHGQRIASGGACPGSLIRAIPKKVGVPKVNASKPDEISPVSLPAIPEIQIPDNFTSEKPDIQIPDNTSETKDDESPGLPIPASLPLGPPPAKNISGFKPPTNRK